MPYLSFTRDHRGYEYTAVVHSGRRQASAAQRILYWFRTPPGVKFGRVPIDEDVIRSLEEHNPGVVFDWEKILQPPPPPKTYGDPRARARKYRRETPAETREESRAEPGAPAPAPAPTPLPVPVAPPLAAAPVNAAPPSVGKTAAKRKRRRRAARGEATTVSPAAPERLEQARLFESHPGAGHDARMEASGDAASDRDAPSGRDQNGTLDLADDGAEEAAEAAGERPPAPASTPAGRVLGPEGLARLRTRCAELMARISERVPDAAQADALRDQAERLNPDAWVTADEVRDGLEHYEQIYQDLRHALGPDTGARRRGRRRGRSGRHGRAGAESTETPTAKDGQAGPEPDDTTS